ncbi:MAG: DUF4388 domain-containing protein [Acidobacteriota bacterium]|nr:DUF4388 domain-containing protein [Acidobacteriota bacterium]
MVERNFQYRGELSKTALPEMLFTIDRFQVPGVIEARRDGIVKQVYIKEGSVIHATSSDRDDSLGTYLYKKGKLGAEVYAATMRDRRRRNKRYGEVLVERGILSPGEVYEGIRAQIEAIVWSLFYWQEGEVAFSIGEFRDVDMLRIQLPMRQVILQGIKCAPNAKALVGRLGRKDTIFQTNFVVNDIIELALDEIDYQLLQLVDGRKSLYEICSAGPMSPSENAKLMYAFQVLQLVRRKAEPGAEDPGSGEVPKTGQAPVKIRLKTPGDSFS